MGCGWMDVLCWSCCVIYLLCMYLCVFQSYGSDVHLRLASLTASPVVESVTLAGGAGFWRLAACEYGSRVSSDVLLLETTTTQTTTCDGVAVVCCRRRKNTTRSRRRRTLQSCCNLSHTSAPFSSWGLRSTLVYVKLVSIMPGNVPSSCHGDTTHAHSNI